MITLKCPKCGSEMLEGFILDMTDAGTSVSQWVAGRPERSWTGPKVGGKERHQIQSYRCRKCGYLESYAQVSLSQFLPANEPNKAPEPTTMAVTPRATSSTPK